MTNLGEHAGLRCYVLRVKPVWDEQGRLCRVEAIRFRVKLGMTNGQRGVDALGCEIEKRPKMQNRRW